jgi:crotonobetainyl-CoA:carnitine CoA-transferase CaiB-like acyl-CoA transferase
MVEYVDMEFPGLEKVPTSGVCVKLSKTPGFVSSPPPRVGEHNIEIYQGILGYSNATLNDLKEKGII